MKTIEQKLEDLTTAFLALFAASEPGEPHVEPGQFIHAPTLGIGFANINGTPTVLKHRGNVLTGRLP